MTMLQISLPDDRYRRWVGFILGGLLGLAYGVVSQLINRVAAPGVPLYQPPYGAVGNIALYTLGGGALGTICAWPLGSIQGTALASAISAIIIVVGSFIDAGVSGTTLIAAAITGIFLALPFWGMLIPLLSALRWGVNGLEEAHRDRLPWLARLLKPALLIVGVGLVGALSLYRPEARILLIKTHTLLQQAQAGGELPEPLRDMTDNAFQTRGAGPFELSWERRDIERYRIPRPGRNLDNHSVVVARFANGWNLVCLYVTLDDPPLCQGFDQLPL